MQLSLEPRAPGEAMARELWAGLPEEAQASLLVLCARLIARGVVVEEKEEDR